jgi:long-chain acyl-CoA synthetase
VNGHLDQPETVRHAASQNPAAALARIGQRLTAPGAPFALDEVKVRGQVQRVYASADANVSDILRRAEAAHGAAVLVFDAGQRFTYAEIFASARRLAASLQAQYGLCPGERIGIAMHNRAGWLIAYAATVYSGAVAVLFNSRGAADELANAIADVPCRLILADDERARLLESLDSGVPIMGTETIGLAIARGIPGPAPGRAPADAPAAILFTSGTTGRAKGAVLTQRNIVNMVRNLALIAASTLELEAELRNCGVAALSADVPALCGLLIFPLFHVSGLIAFFRTIENGGSLVFLRRWDAEAALRIIAERKVTMLSGPPLVLSDLLALPNAAERMASLTALVIGGQATPASLTDRAHAAMPQAGPSIGWGMTEVSGAVAAAGASLCRARPFSCGIRSPLIDLRAVDEDGRTLPCSAAGEILIRGSLVMEGYFNAPEATAAVLRDGWLHTGDIGCIDEHGVVELIDRKKDMILVAGENIHCGEVERVLGSDPEVVEALLFAVPDKRLGERAIAAVRLRPGSARTEAELQALVRARLASYKIPAAIVADLDPLPRNATGKVDKSRLRALYLRRLAATGAPDGS